jgi:thiol-disulfide isomerase/thioredoxin
VLLGVLVLSTAGGVWWRRRDGRLRTVAPPSQPTAIVTTEAAVASTTAATTMATAAEVATMTTAAGADALVVDLAALGLTPGERATLLQLSSAFCAPCRATRTVLREVAAMVPGVVHLEVDAEAHLDLVRRLDVRRTPTTLVLDRAGRVRVRASGQPRRADVVAALGRVVG